MNPPSPLDNQQLINKLAKADYVLQDLRKHRKKCFLQQSQLLHKMCAFQEQYIKRSGEVYQHQLADIQAFIVVISPSICQMRETSDFLRKLQKFFEPSYDFTQSQRLAIKICIKLTRVRRNDKIDDISDIRKILRITSISWNRSDHFELCLQLLQYMLKLPLNPLKQFTTLHVICQQKSLQILFSLLQRGSFYYKQIMLAVLKNLFRFRVELSSKEQYNQKVSKEQDEYIFNQITKFITRSCQIINKPHQIAQNYTTAIQFLSSIHLLSLSLQRKQIKQLYKDKQLEDIELQLSDQQKYISKILYQHKILDRIFTKYNKDQLRLYQSSVIEIIQLMINQLTYDDFQLKIIPFLQKAINKKHTELIQTHLIQLYIPRMLIKFMLLKSQQQDSQDNLFNVFCNTGFLQTITDLLISCHNKQCASRYFLEYDKKFIQISDSLLNLTILGYQMIQKCNISLRNSDGKLVTALMKTTILIQQASQVIDPWMKSVLTKLGQRLIDKKFSEQNNRIFLF